MDLKHDVCTITNIMYLAYHYHLILKLKKWLFLGNNRGYVYICTIR